MEAIDENTQNAKPNQTLTVNKTKKQKRTPKPRPIRDESAYQTASDILDNLRSKKAVSSVDDRRIVEKMLSKIDLLKSDGIGYREIHKALCEQMDLRISFSTFLTYVQKAKGGEGKTAGKQRLVIFVPKDRAEDFQTLADRIASGMNVVCLGFEESGVLVGRIDFGTIPETSVDLAE